MKFFHFSTIISFACLLFPTCFGIPVEEDLKLSLQEKQALEVFQKHLENSVPPLPFEYMKKEIYLIKWLRYTQLDVAQADAALKSHIAWREEMGFDKAETNEERELQDYMDLNYPIFTDGEDYAGRPLIVADVSQWDVRRAVLTGQDEKVYKHAFKKVDMACAKIRDKQARGQNVTQMQIIFDFKGYNLIQHGCLNCLPIYLNFLVEFRRQYTGMADNFFLINTPSIFQTAAEFLNLRSRSHVIKIYGPKHEWENIILSIVSPDQLPDFLGGTKS